MSANLLCQTCLSKDRVLFPVKELHYILRNLNIPIVNDHQGYCICWECRALVIRFLKFKTQVVEAQRLLQNCHEINKALSNLDTISNNSYDYIFINNRLIDNNIKIEIEELKGEKVQIDYSEKLRKCEINKSVNQEANSSTNDNDDEDTCNFEKTLDYYNKFNPNNDNNNETLAQIIDTNNEINTVKLEVETQKTKIRLSCSKLTKTDADELKGKFEVVILNEEEMLRHRDDKRKRWTYKKCPYKCELCILGFAREETYMIHVKNTHVESLGPYSCDICQSRFPTPHLTISHRQQHYVNHKCIMCKYETPIDRAAINHCRMKHGADSIGFIHCTQCDRTFANTEDLAEHNKIKHTILCNQCGEMFKGRSTLRAHKKRIHNEKRSFVCDICNKTFINKTRLESHVVTHDGDLALKLAFCSKCNVQYKNLAIYRNHLRNSRHHSERIYQCKNCQKKFASKAYLKKHREFYHMRKSSYKCEICDKLFISNYKRRTHNQTHHGQTRPRNYPCNACGKKFYTPATLRGHLLTHSDERSYMCEECGDTFKQKPALFTHYRLVHKGYKRHKKETQ